MELVRTEEILLHNGEQYSRIATPDGKYVSWKRTGFSPPLSEGDKDAIEAEYSKMMIQTGHDIMKLMELARKGSEMSRMTSQEEIDEVFGDHNFENEAVEHILCSAKGANGNIIRLMAMIFPIEDQLHYRIETGKRYDEIYREFKTALAKFRELL